MCGTKDEATQSSKEGAVLPGDFLCASNTNVSVGISAVPVMKKQSLVSRPLSLSGCLFFNEMQTSPEVPVQQQPMIAPTETDILFLDHSFTTNTSWPRQEKALIAKLGHRDLTVSNNELREEMDSLISDDVLSIDNNTGQHDYSCPDLSLSDDSADPLSIFENEVSFVW
jgi:hypothetical protein